MNMIGIQKNFTNFHLKCKKCESDDVVIKFRMYSDEDDTIEPYEDDLMDVSLICRNCNQEEIQDYNWVEYSSKHNKK